MIRRTAEEMAFFFVKRGVIEKEDKDVYIYGSELLISEIICTIVVQLSRQKSKLFIMN